MAKLYFRYGAMNCGKTTALMQVAHNYKERGMDVMVIKPVQDTKGDYKLVSRIGLLRKVDYLIEKDANLYETLLERHPLVHPADTIIPATHCILIDEAQFLTREQVNQLLKIVVRLDIPVICYGLRTDFKLDGFEGATRLLELAHSIEELKNICSCGKKAIANSRWVKEKMITEGDQIVIDNIENKDIVYTPLCYNCYFTYKFRGTSEK